jgi:ABC-2 type transport system permease protein
MRKLWVIALNDVRNALRTPILMVMTFVMPIIFTAALGLAFGGDGSEDVRTPLLVVDEDGEEVAQAIRSHLADSTIVRLWQPAGTELLPSTQEEAVEALDEYGRILILPNGLSRILLAGEPVTATFYVADRNPSTQVVGQEIAAALASVENAVNIAHLATEQAAMLAPFADESERQRYFASVLAAARTALPANPITVTRTASLHTAIEAESAPPIATSANQSSPGSLVNFGLIALLSTAVALVEERTVGTLRRLVSSPVGKATLLAGKTLGPLFIGLLQTLVLVLFGQLVFGVQWARSPLALAAVVLCFNLAGVSLGILLSTLVRTTDQAVGVMIGASMSMAALGGAWWPLDIVSPTMQRIAYFFPSAWAMEGYQAVILRGASVADVMPQALALLGFATLFFTLGIWRFRFE